MGMWYKFIKVETRGTNVYALFDKNVTGAFFRLFSKPDRIRESEKGCAQLYKESIHPNAKASSSLADPSSTRDIMRAFREIQRVKLSLGMSLDVPDIDQD